MVYRGSTFKSLFANSKSSMVEKVKLETASLEVFVWKRDNDSKPKFTSKC